MKWDFEAKCKEGISNVLILATEMRCKVKVVACMNVRLFNAWETETASWTLSLSGPRNKCEMKVKAIFEMTEPCLSNSCYIYIIGLWMRVKSVLLLMVVKIYWTRVLCVAVCGRLREHNWSGCAELMACNMMGLSEGVEFSSSHSTHWS